MDKFTSSRWQPIHKGELEAYEYLATDLISLYTPARVFVFQDLWRVVFTKILRVNVFMRKKNHCEVNAWQIQWSHCPLSEQENNRRKMTACKQEHLFSMLLLFLWEGEHKHIHKPLPAPTHTHFLSVQQFRWRRLALQVASFFNEDVEQISRLSGFTTAFETRPSECTNLF